MKETEAAPSGIDFLPNSLSSHMFALYDVTIARPVHH